METDKVLIITFGLTGCGKSFVAKLIKKYLKNSVLIKSDIIRKKIYGFSPFKKVIVPYGTGIYSEEKSEEVYEKMLEITSNYLKKNKNVIIDASFLKKRWREKAREIAIKNNAKFYIFVPFCDEEKIKKRLLKRKRDVSDGRWEIYIKQKENYDEIDEDEKKYTIFIDNNKTKKDVEKFLNKINFSFSIFKNII